RRCRGALADRARRRTRSDQDTNKAGTNRRLPQRDSKSHAKRVESLAERRNRGPRNVAPTESAPKRGARDRPEDKAGRNRDSRGSRFPASIGKRKSTARGARLGSGLSGSSAGAASDVPLRDGTTEGGTKADGIGDSQVARAV